MTAATRAIRSWMNRSVKIGQVLPAYVVLAVGGILGAWQFDNIASQRAGDAVVIAEQRARDVVAEAEQRAADLETRQDAEIATICSTRSEVRTTLREVLLAIIAQFPAEQPGIMATVELLEDRYPEIGVEDCLDQFYEAGS